MTYTRTYKADLNSHQVKKRNETIVCSAFNNPGSTVKLVLAMIQKLSSDLNVVHPEAKHKLPLLCPTKLG